MQDTKETSYLHNTLPEIADIFSREAGSLLTKDCIWHTLGKEEKRFENASALQISPTNFIGNNTDRHCKELLRRSQPFFLLYLLLTFLTEASMIFLIYELFASACQYFFISGKSFTQPFPAIYGIIAITGFLLYRYISHEIWMGQLTRTVDKPEQLLKSIKTKNLLTAVIILTLCTISLAVIYSKGLFGQIQIDILDALTLYAASAILSGIHNLIYDSHLPSFLAVGARTLSPKKKEQISAAAKDYIAASLQQILDKNYASNQSESNIKDSRKALRSRLLSFRIYGALAFFILMILDFLCLWQLLHAFSLPLLLFSLLAVPCTLLCLIIILSAQTVLKTLKKGGTEK